MRREQLKRFAAVFSLLTLFSGIDARVFLNFKQHDYHHDDTLFDLEKDFYREKSRLPSNDLAPYQRNSKRFVGAALLTIAAFSAGFDIYKQERGCMDSNPAIERIVRETEGRISVAEKMRDAINLKWNPIVATEGYFARLGSEITILRAHIAKIDSLKADVVQLLDQKYFTRMDLVQRQITKDITYLNSTAYTDPKVYQAKFFTETVYAITLAVKLGPVGLFLGAKLLGPYISKAVAKGVAKSFASGNPNIVARGIKNFQDRGLFPDTRASIKATFNKYIGSPIKAKFQSLSIKTQTRLTKFGKGVKLTGKFAVVGVFLAYEIYNGWKFFKDCDRKEREARDNLVKVEKSIQNMTAVEKEMNAYNAELVQYYGLLHGNLTSENAMDLVNDTYHMTINAQYQNATIEQNALNIKEYYDNIQATKTGTNTYNFAEVERLTKLLNSAFLKTSFTLECYRRKLVIIATITRDCAIGKGTYASLWATAQTLEGSTLKDCVEKERYLTQQGVYDTIKGVMEVQQKSPICLRNDPGMENSVCTAWRQYKTNAQIQAMEAHAGLTADDVTFFVSKCSPANVTSTYETSICKAKSENQTLATVKATYNRHDATQIENTYNNNCPLSADQKTIICTQKDAHKTKAQVAARYPTYDITAAYDACDPSFGRMCIMHKYVAQNVDDPPFATDVALYGRAKVAAVLQAVAASGACNPVSFGDQAQVNSQNENAFDMLADAVEKKSEAQEDIIGGAVASVMSKIDVVKVCKDLKISPSYEDIVDHISKDVLKALKPLCDSILKAAAMR